MDYGYKPTTHGLAAMAACMALEQPLEITRVAFGGGQIGDGVKLADVHQLVDFVADGTVTDRRHEGEKLCFTVQYANNQHPDVPTFFLSEFMVYIRNPVTGEETDLLYATLGDYRQPVPAYSDGMAPSIWSLPLVLVLSSELEVKVSTPAGLVTWDDVEMLEGALSESIGPLSGSGPPSNETAGRPGQHYLDTETGTEYTCTGVTEEGCRWERSGAASAEEITVGGEKLSQVLEELRPITGAGAPSGGTEGAAGQKYLDTDTGNEFVCTGKDAEGYQWKPVNAGMTEQLIQAHDSDPSAHSNQWKVIGTRIRDPAKPAYGLGGGGDQTGVVALDTGAYTGGAEVSVIVSGVEYDAENMSADGETAPDGTLIIKKVEE